jgi:hypothetical protein
LCREICIPQGQRLRVSIPIVSAEQAAEPAPNWGNVVPALEERLPIAPEDAGYDPRRQRGGVRLVVRNGHSAFGAPASLVYFPEDANRAAVALLSRLRITEGGLVVPLAIPSDARIDGVLVSERGWAPGKRARALRLSLP